MNHVIEWYSGKDNYQKHQHVIDNVSKKHQHSLEILDTEIPKFDREIFDIFADYLSVRQTKTVEILYSGGMDSEIILYGCLVKNIPVRAITLRIMVDGVATNTHDLYYSERFCRKYNIEQKIIDFDAKKFFDNGEHFNYLGKYLITHAHVASHFWLFEQCTGFPVLGGQYTWPWIHVKPMIVSPIRHAYSLYDKFLQDNNIHGIGSMLNYGLELNLNLIKLHIKTMQERPKEFGGDNYKIVFFKNALAKNMGYSNAELRMKSYGWESMTFDYLNISKMSQDLIKHYGFTNSKIIWNNKMANVLESTPGENSRYV